MEHIYQDLSEKNEWFNYQLFYKKMIDRFPSGSLFVELGVYKGLSTSFMAVEIVNSNKKIKFDCYDCGETNIARLALSQFSSFLNYRIVDSIKASQLYQDNSIDFVFIDTSHIYKQTIGEIACWFPKVKIGGILSGHDYYDQEWEIKNGVHNFINYKVKSAVDKLIENPNIEDGLVWWMEKRVESKLKCF